MQESRSIDLAPRSTFTLAECEYRCRGRIGRQETINELPSGNPAARCCMRARCARASYAASGMLTRSGFIFSPELRPLVLILRRGLFRHSSCAGTAVLTARAETPTPLPQRSRNEPGRGSSQPVNAFGPTGRLMLIDVRADRGRVAGREALVDRLVHLVPIGRRVAHRVRPGRAGRGARLAGDAGLGLAALWAGAGTWSPVPPSQRRRANKAAARPATAAPAAARIVRLRLQAMFRSLRARGSPPRPAAGPRLGQLHQLGLAGGKLRAKRLQVNVGGAGLLEQIVALLSPLP